MTYLACNTIAVTHVASCPRVGWPGTETLTRFLEHVLGQVPQTNQSILSNTAKPVAGHCTVASVDGGVWRRNWQWGRWTSTRGVLCTSTSSGWCYFCHYRRSIMMSGRLSLNAPSMSVKCWSRYTLTWSRVCYWILGNEKVDSFLRIYYGGWWH